jgi:NSS family neurotransmitter:Na+ symporter
MSDEIAHEAWSSRFAFILVSIGATVGLGNLWRFPFAVGESGAGAFVLVYLLAVFIIAAPLFMAETLVGRFGRHSAPNTFRILAREHGKSESWRHVGWLCIVTSLLVLSFFSVIAGNSLAYVFKTASGAFAEATKAEINQTFADYAGSPWAVLFWHTAFAGATAFIVSRGIQNGLERAGRVLLPALFLLLVLLVVYAAIEGAFMEATEYLFNFDLAAITPAIVLAAFGQAFFTMSIGSGGILTYGAYIGKRIPIARTTLFIAGGDTLVALLAGLAIFPLALAFGGGTEGSRDYVFTSLPMAFAGMPLGSLVGTLFYLLFAFAAITSTIGLLEVAVSYFEETGKMSRKKAALAMTTIFWFIGIGSALSFNLWADAYPLSFLPVFEEANFMSILNWTIGSVILLAVGFIFAIWAGWWLPQGRVQEELGLSDNWFRVWQLVVRWIAPLVIATIFISQFLPSEGGYGGEPQIEEARNA